ncbi:MAG: bacillithiol system redox-active protein YtxJ [Crocinitomicaceae bacterium]
MGLFSFGKAQQDKVNWVELASLEQMRELIHNSHETPVVFFKHSTRCSISSMAKNRLEKEWDLKSEEVTPVYLDLIRYRDISNALADELNVIHQSPQILLVRDEKLIHQASHNQITVGDIKEKL